MNITFRRVLALTITILAILNVSPLPVQAAYTMVPVFLNGNSVYTRTGEASLLSIAADAARTAVSADAALLPADCAGGSLTEGSTTPGRIRTVLPEHELVQASVSPDELAELLNRLTVYGSGTFPHLSGVRVWAERVLNAKGEYTARVMRIEQGSKVLAALSASCQESSVAEYSTSDVSLTLVTTTDIAAMFPWLAHRAVSTGRSTSDAFIEYLRITPTDAIVRSLSLDDPRLVIVSDVIDVPLSIEKLTLDVPSAVTVNLSRPDIIADTLMYALGGQNREFICRIWRGDFPYALWFSGVNIDSPENVSTAATVSQTVPPGRKTANTFDKGAVFADTRDNTTLPAGSVMSVCVGRVYEPGTILYVYRYEENGDIGPAVAENPVNTAGYISFPVARGETYVINNQKLDSSGIELPSAAHPYTAGVVCIAAAYVVWVALFLTVRHRKGRHP